MTTRDVTQYLPLSGEGAWPESVRRRLSDRAFVVAWACIQWPWLARSLSGGSRREKAALLRELELPADALPNLGSWKADTGLLRLIVDHIREHRPRTVVEIGAGASTLVVARALQLHGGGKLLSFDQHAEFVKATREWLQEFGVDAELRAVPLAEAPGDWPGVWYDIGGLPASIDLIVIDGPPWSIHPFVRGAAEVLFDRVPVGGTILLDDGARPGERVVMARWRRRWPNFRFELVKSGTKGTVVGTRLR